MTGPVIIGVDPGKTGAIAAVDSFTGELLGIEDMPMLEGGLVNGHLVAAFVNAVAPGPRVAWVERVHAMPKQGVSSSFSFGASYGGIVCGLTMLGIPVELVTPNVWKRDAGLGKDKGAARAMASRLWPTSSELFRRVKDDGRAEAALIARHGAGSPT